MTEKVDFTGVQSTMLVTLYLRATESRTKDSVLGDRWADELLSRIDYDFRKLRFAAGSRYVVALRARQLDEWSRDFLRRHPDATVLQLGCGLDSRALRLDVPEQVRWFDVDHADVIELHRRLFPESERYRTIAASVTESEWWDQVPTDRPVLVIAEGLLMYLPEEEVRRLLRRITDRFPSGEVVFDAASPAWVRMTKVAPRGYPSFQSAIGDGREVERWNPRLRYREAVSVLRQFPRIPVRSYRIAHGLLGRLPGMRDWMRVFRFEF
ncbi:methyltransferase, TIGR00027 family [Streptoalloteichus tenebrarius]|uniref:Methyltransferase, TIGR00027 family n=1 Tax=Streptoalloteichus tenebrarius (strain ATCC 17920 / DSM 40477 / JCM 4838 / CBS 697.72 / NBRC 16177 / NCIMB 11028 / NRRL B-12390 / A12253. 1 / ISP 5477) TaxID=1933 RepID=A0ABT1HRV5_STRSD|nr:class I SAM-dependent methyltransferase [Streptoalloteichus tenebrarius]MCP2258255.1 methyltransferase, TIGR00027 family [Streptoalloteichus tenebrarius]BFF04515.1 class I SAM-dependent methyltransferase [Streptoalloteichus tenebrarius]